MAHANSDARTKFDPARDWSRRFALLAVASVACSVITAVVSLVALRSLVSLQWGVPPSDSAYGEPVWSLLTDPFVLMVAIPATIVGAVFGFAAALSFLLDTELSKSIPATLVATPFAAGMFAVAGSIFGAALGGFFFGVVTMMLCGHYFPRRTAHDVRVFGRSGPDRSRRGLAGGK